MTRFVSMVLALMAAWLPASAQWQPTAGPRGATVYALAGSGLSVLAEGWDGGVHRWSGGGWERIEGISPTHLWYLSGAYYASDAENLYRSSNNGMSWQTLPLPSASYMVGRNGVGLYAADQTQVFRSLDNGITWNQAAGFGDSIAIVDFVARGSSVGIVAFSPAGSRVMVSRDDCHTWDTLTPGDGSPMLISALEIYDDTVVVATGGLGILRSDDRGATWSELNAGLDGTNGLPFVSQLLYSSKGLWASAEDGVYRLSGGAWSRKSAERDATMALVSSNPQLQLMIGGATGIYATDDGGETWESFNDGLRAHYIADAAQVGERTLVGTPGGIYATDDRGTAWTRMMPYAANRLAHEGTTVIAGLNAPRENMVIRSTDAGTTWADISANVGNGSDNVSAMASSAGFFYVGTGASTFFEAARMPTGGLFRSTDNGETWEPAADGLPLVEGDLHAAVAALGANGASIVAAAGDGIYYSEDFAFSWHAADLELPFPEMPARILATGTEFYLANAELLFRSTDNGRTWNQENLELDEMEYIDGLALVNGRVVLFATDGAPADSIRPTHAFVKVGAAWNDISDRFPQDAQMREMVVSGSTLLGGTRGSSVLRAEFNDVFGVQAGVQTGRSLTFNLRAFPNPFVSDVTVSFTTEESGHVKLTIVNALGETVKVAFEGDVEAGDHTVVLDAAELPAGVWYYHLSVNDRTAIGKLVRE